MRAFAGKRCSVCKESIPEGTDVHYEPSTKTVAHWACYEKDEPPGPEQFRLADELGFVREIGSSDWARICARWQVWNLPTSHRSDSAGRLEPGSHPRPERTLF